MNKKSPVELQNKLSELQTEYYSDILFAVESQQFTVHIYMELLVSNPVWKFDTKN